jgi:hypothetical protein
MFTQHLPTMHDSVASLSNNNVAHFALLPNDNLTTSEELFHSEELFGDNVAPDTTESPVETDYSCFTTSQQCITSLMHNSVIV